MSTDGFPSNGRILASTVDAEGHHVLAVDTEGGVNGQALMAGSSPVVIASDQSAIQVVGNVASAATDSGNPVKAAGKYSSTTPTFTNGQRGDLQIGARGALRVQLQAADGSNGADVSGPLDAAAPTGLDVTAMQRLFNGTNWDRRRGNVDLTLFSSAARTATPSNTDQTNHNAKGLHVVIDVTAATSTPSTVFTIEGKDAISGKYYTILASAAIVGVGTTVLRVHPGLTVAANLVANDILPRVWRVTAVHGNANSQTYSVGASLIL